MKGKCFAYNEEKRTCGCLTKTCSNCYSGSPCRFYKTTEQKKADECNAMARCRDLGMVYGMCTNKTSEDGEEL